MIKKTLSSVIFNMFVIALIGVLFIVVDPSSLMRVVLIIIGVFLILANIGNVFFGIASFNQVEKPKFFISCMSFIIGFLLVFWQNQILNIVVAVWFVAMPIYRIIISKNKSIQLRNEVPQFIIGALLLVFGPWAILDILFLIIGIVLLVVSVLQLAFFFYGQYKEKRNSNVMDAKIVSKKDID